MKSYYIHFIRHGAISPTLKGRYIGTTDVPLSEDGKTDNVSIGDTVTFTITSKVPSHATDYDFYYFIINDTCR